VDQLNPVEGRLLLKNIGVKGLNVALDRIVQNWNGHALSLTLVGNYLVETKSKIGFDKDIGPQAMGDNRYQKIQQVLRRYDEFMGLEERIFLNSFQLFAPPSAARNCSRFFTVPRWPT